MPAKKRSLLPLIEIWNPCPVSWDEMIGNDEVRYCGQCSKHVYNLSGLRRSEAEALVAASHGRMCARFIRTADGDVQTVPELPPQVHGNARRASPAAAAIVTAVLGLGGSGAALVRPAVAQVSSRQSSESQPKPDTDTAAGGAMASLSGKVTRRNGNPIPGAKVALTSVGAGATLRTTPGPDGLYRFQSVPEGSYELTTGADGLITTTFQGLELAAGRNVQLDVMMESRPSAPSGVVSISPTPLHSLYTRASVIIVGAPASSSTVENGQYSSSIKTRVNVLQVLKGQPKRDSIDVYHDEMRDGQDPFAGGAPLLLFLEHRENKGLLTRSSYEPVDTLSAVKKLSQSALASYVDHLKSLQNILREEAPSRTELTEWAVQLAEDPVTREEAGNELDPDGYDPIFQSSDAEPPEKAPASAPSPTSTMSGAAPGPGTVAADAPLTVALAPVSDERQVCAFVTASDLLTPSQKNRVMNVILGIGEISEDDFSLIRVAGEWGENRLAPFLISKLEQMEADPLPIAGSLMYRISALLDDDSDLKDIASDYSDYDDADAPDSSDSAKNGTAGSAPVDHAADRPADPKEQMRALIRQFVSAAKAKI